MGDILGTAPARDGVVVVGTLGLHSKVAASRLGEIEAEIHHVLSVSCRSRSRPGLGRVDGIRTALGSVIDATHESGKVDGAPCIDLREARLGTAALEQIALATVIRLARIIGLWEITRCCDDFDGPKYCQSQSRSQGRVRYRCVLKVQGHASSEQRVSFHHQPSQQEGNSRRLDLSHDTRRDASAV